jgi:hypothetical protein
MASQPLASQGLLTLEVSRLHSDTPHSVGLLRASDQLVAETSARDHTTNTTEAGEIRNRNPSKPVAANPRLRPRGH